MASEREIFRNALAPGKDCLSVEKLERCLDASMAPGELTQHLESCAHCRAELELLRSFDIAPRPDEADAVRAVTERLQSPRPLRGDAPTPWWKGLLQARWFTPAAVVFAGVLMAVSVGIQSRDGHAPRLYAPSQPQEEIMRSGTITGVAPAGDVTTVPTQIQWQPVAGAARYEVHLLEVDRAPLWSISTTEHRIELPTDVQAKIVPSKTLLLDVIALDASGRKLAESAFVRFRLLQNVYGH